jgi:hypothetical protein
MAMIVVLCCMGIAESGIIRPVKYWETVADKLSTAGSSWVIAVPSTATVGAMLLTRTAKAVTATSSN